MCPGIAYEVVNFREQRLFEFSGELTQIKNENIVENGQGMNCQSPWRTSILKK